MSVEFVLKLRDAAQQIADAANEYLEKQAPADVRAKTEDFNKLSWTVKEGTKGNYEQTSKEANQNNEIFQELQQILADHKGFWQNSSYKYWNHQDNLDIIDRREIKKN